MSEPHPPMRAAFERLFEQVMRPGWEQRVPTKELARVFFMCGGTAMGALMVDPVPLVLAELMDELADFRRELDGVVAKFGS